MISTNDIKVTIAIPVYNCERYLTDCIRSVINQTYKNWILLLINDGSTDGSLSIMNDLARSDERIKVIDDGLNKGLVSRLNQSISMSQTIYYARMDADDIMYHKRIEEQVNFLEQHPEVDVLGSSIMTIDENNNIVGSGFTSGEVQSFIHPTVIGKSAWFRSHPYQEWAVRAEDKELWLRTQQHSNFYSLKQPLLFYREFGTFNFSKIYLSYKTEIKIYLNYRLYSKSFNWFLSNTIKTFVKMFLYMIASSLKLTKFIINLRSRKTVPNGLCLTETDLLLSIKG